MKLDPDNNLKHLEQLAIVHSLHSVPRSSLVSFTNAEEEYIEDATRIVIKESRPLSLTRWRIIRNLYNREIKTLW
jgi:hypothetical protein